jgi:hypothetical protein
MAETACKEMQHQTKDKAFPKRDANIVIDN